MGLKGGGSCAYESNSQLIKEGNKEVLRKDVPKINEKDQLNLLNSARIMMKLGTYIKFRKIRARRPRSIRIRGVEAKVPRKK